MFRLFNVLQVFHASYVLQVISQQVDQALVPMRDFVLGSSLRTRHLSLENLQEPLRDRLTSSPVKVADIPVPLGSRKLSGQVSSPRSSIPNSRIERSQNIHRSTTTDPPPSIDLAQQITLVNSLTPHDISKQPKQDLVSVKPSRASLFPAATSTVSPPRDCPLIDLVALVREKQKTKKIQKKKPPVFLVRERPYPRVDLRGPSYESSR